MVKVLLNSLVAFSVLLVSTNATAGIESPKQVTEKVWVMGLPSAAQIEQFADQGGDIVINLLSDNEMKGSHEPATVTRNGMAYYHVPVNGADGVSLENARLVDRVILQNSDKTVLLHCASSNRVGALMALRAAWLDGLSVEDALALGRDSGMTSLEGKVTSMLNSQ